MNIIIDLIIIVFPISLYLLNIAYNNNYKKILDKYTLSIILIFETLIFIIFRESLSSLILINVPLLISYLKRYEVTSILLSIILLLYYTLFFKYNIYFIFLEYVLYFVIYLIFNKKVLKKELLLYIFIFIKSIILSIEIFYFNINNNSFIINLLNITFKMLLFYICSYFIIVFLERGEEIMNLNTAIKELEKEKVLRTSLFKMTHEIKNPIAVCKGYLDMLDINDKSKLNKYIPIIKSEVDRTLTLMDDYLEYTKIKINKDITDIYMLLDEVIKSLKLYFKENNITLENNIPDDELYLNIDYNRIKQVIVNLLKNASEARDVRKSEMKIKISTKVLKNKFLIIIEDNGIGMDNDTLNNVTNLFFTTKRNGTGLGTSLSKEIIELHAGSLKYDSQLNIGTKVIITLPIDKNLNS
ncbi:MAG: HAMP domain-containing histidine kinase [Bacilli bacterium]|nr:HAMP domain-containing histidine kinase [Bacilli bacterium]